MLILNGVIKDMENNKMPFGFKLIMVFYILILIMLIVGIAKNPSQLTEPLEILRLVFAGLITLAVITGIYLRKWRSAILWFIGLGFVVGLFTVVKFITTPIAQLLEQTGTTLPSDVNVAQLEEVVKGMILVPISIGFLIVLFVWLYIYKHKEYFSN